MEKKKIESDLNVKFRQNGVLDLDKYDADYHTWLKNNNFKKSKMKTGSYWSPKQDAIISISDGGYLTVRSI